MKKIILILILFLVVCLGCAVNQKLIKTSYLQGRYDENATMIEWQKRNLMSKQLLEHRKVLLKGSAKMDGIELKDND